MEKALWRMPAWMEQYRVLIGQAGDNTVEELMIFLMERDVTDDVELYTRAVSVRSQINLLYELEAAGALTSMPV